MDLNEKFWVYTNWTEPHARVHFGSCSYCNNGTGTDKEKSDKNGEWLGPFDTYDKANIAAVGFIRAKSCTDKKIDCEYCNPHP